MHVIQATNKDKTTGRLSCLTFVMSICNVTSDGSSVWEAKKYHKGTKLHFTEHRKLNFDDTY